MSYLKIEEVELYYEIKGPPSTNAIVFIHAGIADSRMWDDQFNFFGSEYFTVRYDLRCFGKSSCSQSEFSHAADLLELLNHLKITHIHLVGCSFGCQVVFDFVLEHPQMVRSLTLVNGRPFGYEDMTKFQSSILAQVEQAYDQKDIKQLAKLEALMWFVGEKRTLKEVDNELFQKVVQMNNIVITNEFAFQPNDFKIHPNAMQELENISCPCLFIVGLLDNINFVESCKNLAKRMKSEIYFIEETAHFPNLEKPIEFNDALKKFLKKI